MGLYSQEIPSQGSNAYRLTPYACTLRTGLNQDFGVRTGLNAYGVDFAYGVRLLCVRGKKCLYLTPYALWTGKFLRT